MTALAPAEAPTRPHPSDDSRLAPTPLLPDGFQVPVSRWTHPSVRMRALLRTEPYLFGPGVYDPFGAQLVMHHGFKAVYFSGYSFAIGHLGTTDMDLYSGPEIADGARRTVAALRKYQLTAAVGDPEKGMPPQNLPDADIAAIVAFIHDTKSKADSLEGARRSVDVADLQTGHAQAGQQYFNGAGGCAKCHSPTGDLAGLANRLQGLQLFQRMLYPGGRGRGGASAAVPVATVKLPSGQSLTGKQWR